MREAGAEDVVLEWEQKAELKSELGASAGEVPLDQGLCGTTLWSPVLELNDMQVLDVYL